MKSNALSKFIEAAEMELEQKPYLVRYTLDYILENMSSVDIYNEDKDSLLKLLAALPVEHNAIKEQISSKLEGLRVYEFVSASESPDGKGFRYVDG